MILLKCMFKIISLNNYKHLILIEMMGKFIAQLIVCFNEQDYKKAAVLIW